MIASYDVGRACVIVSLLFDYDNVVYGYEPLSICLFFVFPSLFLLVNNVLDFVTLARCGNKDKLSRLMWTRFGHLVWVWRVSLSSPIYIQCKFDKYVNNINSTDARVLSLWVCMFEISEKLQFFWWYLH